MSSSSRTTLLHFDGPFAVDDGDLLVAPDGEVELIVEPKALEDWVEERLEEDGYEGYSAGPADDEWLTVDGRYRSIPTHRPDTYVCLLHSGKDVYHGFDGAGEFLDLLPRAIGTKAAKMKAIRFAEQYWPDDYVRSALYREAAAECRAEIRSL